MNTLRFVLFWMRFLLKKDVFINGGMREFLAAYLPQLYSIYCMIIKCMMIESSKSLLVQCGGEVLDSTGWRKCAIIRWL
jgi:hypothetical protein